MKTVGISMWKAAVGRHFRDRADHLLRKAGIDQWVFVVRRTNDLTLQAIQVLAERSSGRIIVVVETWPAPTDRMARLSRAADAGIETALAAGASRVLYHESDLRSPDDVVERLEATKAAIVGGWPVLPGHDCDRRLLLRHDAMLLGETVFYDTWAYRVGGVRFMNKAPYHAVYAPDRPFRLDSVGSVALIDADYLRRGARFAPGAFVSLCEQARSLGGEVWCDPRIEIQQPLELWEFNND
jgi:hypothetical protein